MENQLLLHKPFGLSMQQPSTRQEPAMAIFPEKYTKSTVLPVVQQGIQH
jgi:hypothetical protein